HIEAFAAGLGTSEFYIQSRTRSRAEDLAQRMQTQLDVQVQVVDTLAQIPDQVRLYASATTSQTPVLPEQLPADAFVAAVGAFKPDMAELPPALLRSSQVVVDTVEGAQAE